MIMMLLTLVIFSVIVASARIDAESSHPTTANCTWFNIEQPLSHFARGVEGTFKQRVCTYGNYWTPNNGLPVFLYTGNESPVDEYVNNTGLIWDLAKSANALVVFAEHRYFGESIPQIEGMENCLAYLSSEEALADYASLANRIRREMGAKDSPIIAFGGSYGGMLASWMRILYPSAVDGAIAASAPVWGFPMDGCPVDGSATVVSYAASEAAGAAARCADNLKASYVLLSDIGSTKEGRDTLSSAINLCTPLDTAADVSILLNYLQSPLFDLSEGSYPFPSDYITYALTGSTNPLPPWAMQVMCEPLGADFGVSIAGDTTKVDFTVTSGKVQVYVDWDKTTNNQYSQSDVAASGAISLLTMVAQSIQVWYNVSGDLPSCIDWQQSASSKLGNHKVSKHTAATSQGYKLPRHSVSKHARSTSSAESSAASASTITSAATADTKKSASVENTGKTSGSGNVCTMAAKDLDPGTAWNALVCNEGINLVNWWAQGVGNDLYWPPNQPKDYSFDSMVPGSLAFCPYLQGVGLYGVPEKGDDWSFWLDTAYGGTRLEYASNIVYSNGNLDPWSPAGVALTEASSNAQQRRRAAPKKLSKDGSVVSVLIDMGGHHLDLFWPTEQDPESVREVRALEKEHIMRWIDEVTQRNQESA